MTVSSGNTVPFRLVVHSLELLDPVCVIGRRVTENVLNDEGKRTDGTVSSGNTVSS